MSRPLVMPLVNLLTLGAVIALNGLAASGALSGDSIGALANRHASLFLPANRVFGIWSLIYLGLVTCAVYQWLPLEGARRAVHRLGWWWLVTGLLNVAWITLFSFRLFGPALLVMLAFLGALVVTTERLRTPALPLAWHERLAVRWPFDLYLAWISVALISNTFQYAHVVEFGGVGIDETAWSIALMIAASLLGIVMAWSRDMWVFPLVVAWAIHGIGTRYADLRPIAEAARLVVPAGILLGAVAWGLGRVRSRSAAAARATVGP